MEEEKRELISELTLSLGGDPPDIPLPGDVNAAELGDMFVTLPITKVGAKSRNGYTYTEKAVQEIAAQINTKRPEGRWGHLKPSERDSRYDPPAVRWLVSQLAPDGTLWAKGIPITADSKEHFRVAKAAHAPVGTSLYGVGTFKGQQVVGFELETIDLGDPARVGLLEAVAPPRITSEMTQEGETVGEQELTQQIQELTQASEGDKRLITELTQERDTQKALIAELCQLAGAEKPDAIKQVVSELITARDTAVATARAAIVKEVVGELVNEKLTLTRNAVLKALGTPDTDDKTTLKARITELLQGEDIKPLAEMERKALGGPNALVGNQHNPNGGLTLEDTPERRANARAHMGF